MTSIYSFRAYGRTHDAVKVECLGEVKGGDPLPDGTIPKSVLEKARSLVLNEFPTFRFYAERRAGTIGYPTVRYLKKKSYRLQRRRRP